MSHMVGQIGYFQLSNLVRNKVPFSLLALDFDPAFEEASVQVKADLQKLVNLASRTTVGALKGHLQEKGVRPEHPIVLVCQQGADSAEASEQLIAAGFLNVFYVRGGWAALLKDAGLG